MLEGRPPVDQGRTNRPANPDRVRRYSRPRDKHRLGEPAHRQGGSSTSMRPGLGQNSLFCVFSINKARKQVLASPSTPPIFARILRRTAEDAFLSAQVHPFPSLVDKAHDFSVHGVQGHRLLARKSSCHRYFLDFVKGLLGYARVGNRSRFQHRDALRQFAEQGVHESYHLRLWLIRRFIPSHHVAIPVEIDSGSGPP